MRLESFDIPLPSVVARELRNFEARNRRGTEIQNFPDDRILGLPGLKTHPLFQSRAGYKKILSRFYDGKKGKDAIRATERIFPLSEIGKAKIPNRNVVAPMNRRIKNPEAVDSYFAQRVNLGGKEYVARTHVYDPTADGSKSADRARRELVAQFPGQLIEYKDGNPVVVDNPLGNSVGRNDMGGRGLSDRRFKIRRR